MMRVLEQEKPRGLEAFMSQVDMYHSGSGPPSRSTVEPRISST